MEERRKKNSTAKESRRIQAEHAASICLFQHGIFCFLWRSSFLYQKAPRRRNASSVTALYARETERDEVREPGVPS
jgi:hypothetical protein